MWPWMEAMRSWTDRTRFWKEAMRSAGESAVVTPLLSRVRGSGFRGGKEAVGCVVWIGLCVVGRVGHNGCSPWVCVNCGLDCA
jgi:hypothetical protein